MPTRGIQQLIEQGHGALLRHSKPEDLNEALWAVLSRCWALYPASRPTMKQVVRELRELKSLLEPRE